MDIEIRCSVCGLLMIIEEVAASKSHCAIVMHVSPCPCSSRPIQRAVDGATPCAECGSLLPIVAGKCGNCGTPRN